MAKAIQRGVAAALWLLAATARLEARVQKETGFVRPAMLACAPEVSAYRTLASPIPGLPPMTKTLLAVSVLYPTRSRIFFTS